MLRLIVFCLLINVIFASCSQDQPQKQAKNNPVKKTFDYSAFALEVGDILFQDSDCGPFCEAIEKVTFGVDGAKFSHVGLVATGKDQQLAIIEAISAGVVITHLDTFFNRSFDDYGNSKVVVGRLKPEYRNLIPLAVAYAKTKLGKPYDEVFNVLNDKYYCSELLYEAFSHANGDQPIFDLQKMTYKDPDTNETFPIWKKYFEDLGVAIPEGQPGLNPGSMSRSRFIDIVKVYGKPQGMKIQTTSD
ncbi:MAG: YiiX/YebB-like N1pC/P60 family cysteine hydrolase [Bacteroidota bacterium]